MRYLVLSVALLAGCATQPQNPPPKISELNTCGELRMERARILGLMNAARTTLHPIYAQNVIAKGHQRTAAVEQKAADMGCREGFSS